MHSALKIMSFQGSPRQFSYSIEMFKKECLPQPSLLLSQSMAPLSAILIVLVVMGLLSPKFLQAKVLLIERFYSDSAADRVQHLHAKIVRKRTKNKLRSHKSTLVSYTKNVSRLVERNFRAVVILRLYESTVILRYLFRGNWVNAAIQHCHITPNMI